MKCTTHFKEALLLTLMQLNYNHFTSRPCAQGELVPKGAAFAAVLSFIVVIMLQRLLKSSS